MREYGKVFSRIWESDDFRALSWLDENGTEHRVLAARRLDYSQDGPAALRSFVMRRDGSRCVICTRDTDLVLDHILSLRNGGTNHPANMRVLCGTCNCRKVGLFDATGAATKPHLAGHDWMAWMEGGELRYGLIRADDSVRFRLPIDRAVELAEAILHLAGKGG